MGEPLVLQGWQQMLFTLSFSQEVGRYSFNAGNKFRGSVVEMKFGVLP
jgi:hypothetical protein